MQRTTLPIVKGGLKRRLRQTSGVIDLASIMVGVIIVGILSTGIVATTFALIPFSQDAAAEQALHSVRTAEGAAYVSGQPNRYLNMDGLVASEWIQDSAQIVVGTDADGTCYAAMSLSATGNRFWTDNSTADIVPYVAGTSASDCLDLDALSDTLVSADSAAAATGVLDAVRDAEDVAYADAVPNEYVDMAGLVAAGLIDKSSTTVVEVNPDASGFAAMTVTGSGAKFWTDSGTSSVLLYVAGESVSAFYSLADLSAALDAANGGAVVASPASTITVAAGTYYSLALDADGNLLTWGNDGQGQLGNGAPTGNVTVPTDAVAGQTFTQIASGSAHSLALDAAGNLWTWGYDNYGQLGNGATTGNVTVPTKVAADQTFTQIAAGTYHSLALDAAGNLWTWGYNNYGQLGNGTPYGNVNAPAKLDVAGQTFTQITAGNHHSLALDAAGNLWTWGGDGSGQLGNGAPTGSVNVPTKVAAGQTFTQITAGDSHSLALDAAGNLWTWGESSQGQLGNGGNTDVFAPAKVAVGQTFTQIAAGYTHSLALDAAGTPWTWGDDGYGQLGNGTTGSMTTPTKVAVGQTFTQIAAGYYHSLALDAAGNPWTWGYDNYGQLGNGAPTGNVTVPTEVAWK